MTEPFPESFSGLSPAARRIADAIRQQIRNVTPSDVSRVDQLQATYSDMARTILAHYIMAGLFGEQKNTEKEEDAIIRTNLALRALDQSDATGVILILTGIITDFLLSQAGGNYATVVAQVTDPHTPLIKGKPSPQDDPLWHLDQEG